ncbi:MAG TPA: nickel-binding protein [Kribbellaceae bacterium]
MTLVPAPPAPYRMTGIPSHGGGSYRSYWVDEENRKVFCLVDAPTADAAVAVHREAHGLVADQIYEVVEGS